MERSLQPSYLHNGITYHGKTTCFYWDGPPVVRPQPGLSTDAPHAVGFMKCLFCGCGCCISIHLFHSDVFASRDPFQHKDHLSMYEDFHYKDEIDVRPSYLYDGNPYTGKTASLYWDSPLSAAVERLVQLRTDQGSRQGAKTGHDNRH